MGGGEVIKSGWLVKSPPLEGGGIKVWRKRYFKLRSSKVLEYYKNEDADLLKGVINLEDCISVHSELSHKKYKYVFDIETRQRVYYLVAQNQKEMKEWVDTLCRVCGLTVHQDAADEVFPAASASHYASGSATLTPTITPPIYADTRRSASTSGPVAFTERFHTEGPPVESMYALAHAMETEVQRELGHEQEVPAGVPLMEALATKGIGPRTSSLSSASGSDASTGHVSDSAFSPRHEQSASGGNQIRPTPKPRSSTAAPRPVSDAAARTDLQQNSHYMRPRPSPTTNPNYDQLPIGPPRPSLTTNPNYDQVPHGPPRPAPSPSRHRSALFREEVGNNVGKAPPTYINVPGMASTDLPPPVDRSIKPPEPSPPRIDRKLKPKQSLSGDAETPPECPTRISSLTASRNNFSADSFAEAQLQSSVARTSVSSSIGEDDGFAVFSETDLPRHSRSTLKYTQVKFDAASGKSTLSDVPGALETGSLPSDSEDAARRLPVPAPRGISRVNYSDVDLAATRALAESKLKNPTLREAEMQALKEKQYINVKRDGDVDDNTDPDYYTYMRSQVYEQALDAYTDDGELDGSEEVPEELVSR